MTNRAAAAWQKQNDSSRMATAEYQQQYGINIMEVAE